MPASHCPSCAVAIKPYDTALDPGGQVERLIAGAAAAAVLGLPSLLNPKGMAMGAAKLVGVLGLFLGAAVAPGLLRRLPDRHGVRHRRHRAQGHDAGPQDGPAVRAVLALGGLVGALAGNELVQLYLAGVLKQPVPAVGARGR